MSAQKPQEVLDLMAALKESLALNRPGPKEPEAGRPEAVEHEEVEHVWREEGEELRVTDQATWYKEGEDWRRANTEWSARFLRQELLRVAARVRDLESEATGLVQREALFDQREGLLEEREARITALEETNRGLAEALEAIRAYELASTAELETLTGEPCPSLPWMDQLEAALRKAGRLS